MRFEIIKHNLFCSEKFILQRHLIWNRKNGMIWLEKLLKVNELMI